MKKILALLMVLIVFASLTACGNKVADVVEETPAPTPTETVEAVVVDEPTGVKEDGFRRVNVPELEVTFIGDAVTNGNNYVTLDGYEITDDAVTINISTDMDMHNAYYEIYSDETGEEVIYAGTAGLSYGGTGDAYTIVLNRGVFTEPGDMESEVEPEWENLPKKFIVYSGLDTSITINLDLKM